VSYTIQITPTARRQLDELPAKIRRQIEKRIGLLANDPVPQDAKRLKGSELGGLFRARSGDYRIIYEVQHQKLTVVVLRIGDRKDVYR